MKRSRLDFKAAVLILSSFALAPAKATGEMTAGDLYALCTSADQNASTACRFYVLGVVQGTEMGDGAYMAANRQLLERRKTILCLSEGVSQSQMVSFVRDALKIDLIAYPGDKELPATSLIVAAMNRKFPCPR